MTLQSQEPQDTLAFAETKNCSKPCDGDSRTAFGGGLGKVGHVGIPRGCQGARSDSGSEARLIPEPQAHNACRGLPVSTRQWRFAPAIRSRRRPLRAGMWTSDQGEKNLLKGAWLRRESQTKPPQDRVTQSELRRLSRTRRSCRARQRSQKTTKPYRPACRH